MITTPKAFKVSYTQILRTIAQDRKAVFFNGGLCQLDIHGLAIRKTYGDTIHFKNLLSLAAYVRTGKDESLTCAIVRLYLRIVAGKTAFCNAA